MKKIFGHIYLFDTASPYLGRNVAEHDFFSALLRYGTFDEYHFFFDSSNHQQDFARLFSRELGLPVNRNRVKLFSLAQLEAQVKTVPYTVFHATDPMIDKLITMRNRYDSCEPFCVTGYTHTLSARYLLPGYVMTLLSGPGACDAVICSSIHGRDVVRKVFDGIATSFRQADRPEPPFQAQLPCIPLGVFTEDFGNVSREDARRHLGLQPDIPVILSIARLTPSSKMDYYPLIDVFAIVVRRYPAARLILAGGITPDKQDYLRELQSYAARIGVTEQLVFCPNFDPSVKPLLYSASDIFVSPSDNTQETFGLTILEAMASGRPVICSDWDGYKELVEDGVTGYKIPTYAQQHNNSIENISLFSMKTSFIMAQHTAVDQQAMAEKLLLLLSDAARREQLGKQGRQQVIRYDWKTLIPEYETLWVNLKQQALKNAPAAKMVIDFPFYQLFSHYPTETLNDSMHFAITEKGRLFAENKMELTIHSTVQEYLDMPTVSHCLRMLRLKTQAVARIKEKAPHTLPERVESSLLWLLKIGAIRRE